MRRRKRESGLKTALLLIVAIIFMIMAISVVVIVFGKIHSDYEKLDMTKASEQQTLEVPAVETTENNQLGWEETEEGWKYKIDEKTYAEDEWLDVNGFLYHFDEKGIMATGQWKGDGQIYTCHDVKGYLKNIEPDPNYVPEDTGENLDSFVRTNAFWCYLDSEDTGLFKTILYKKTIDNKVKPLGNEKNPEKATKNSLRAYGDYVYYLPKVAESRKSSLSDEEKELCDVLFRMMPGQNTKEIIAENVDGYLVLDGTIYYAQEGKIYKVTSGTEVELSEGGYQVKIDKNACYLVTALGKPVTAKGNTNITIEDRVYRIDENGKISYVKKNPTAADGNSYELQGTGSQMQLVKKTSSGIRTIAKADYGVQSYCIVDNSVFFSAYVEKDASGKWYSRIYKTDLNGKEKKAVSGIFPGAIFNLYYFESQGEIYGEYHPKIWENAYGVVIQVKQDGTIYAVKDSSERTGKTVTGNDMIEILALQDGEMIGLWHDCSWNRTGGISQVLWSQPVSLDVSLKTKIETADEIKQEETTAQETTTAAEKIIPVSPVETAGNATETGKVQPSQSHTTEAVETEAPGKRVEETTVAPAPVTPTTSPASETTAEEIKIVPLS